MFRAVLGGRRMMMFGLDMVTVSDMGMVMRLLVITRPMCRCRFLVVPRGVLVMGRGLLVMIGKLFLAHGSSPFSLPPTTRVHSASGA